MINRIKKYPKNRKRKEGPGRNAWALFFTMNEVRLKQQFWLQESPEVKGNYDIFMSARVGDHWSAKHLMTVDSENKAEYFVDHFTKHWDDIYEIPRWINKFLKYA